MISEEFLDKIQKLVREGKPAKRVAEEMKISYALAVIYMRKVRARITEQEEQLFNNIFKNTKKRLK